MDDLTIVVACASLQGDTIDRVIAAYERESEGAALTFLCFPHGHGATSAWTLGAKRATGHSVHFTTDDYEPHPGWLAAAAGALRAHVVPAPVLWSQSGEQHTFEHVAAGGWVREHVPASDWQKTSRSFLPFLSRHQLKEAGPPHVGAHPWPALPTVVRTDYAFTRRMSGPDKETFDA